MTMSIIESSWTPSISRTEKKNTKFMLAQAIITVWREIQACKDEETKDKIIKALLMVL